MLIGPTVTLMSVHMVKIVLCGSRVYKAVWELVSHCYPTGYMRAGKSITAVQIKAIYCHGDPSEIIECFQWNIEVN